MTSTSSMHPVSSIQQQQTFVQFGCGLCAPDGWTNFDSSLALRLQHLPIVGSLMPSGPFGRFPKNVQYGDIVQGLPLADESVDVLYCSHILEHLTVEEVHLALKNCYRHLKPGGIFRLVLPDIEVMAREYVNSDAPDAVHEFMRLTWLGKESQNRSILSFLKEWVSRGQHLWMWDYKALSQELENAGFQNIRRARFGDSGMSELTPVEDPERWTYELGIQCTK